MIIPTHTLLADAVYHQLQHPLALPLNRWFFRFGNIKPDLPWNFPGLSHYRAKNFQEVLAMIDRTVAFGLQDTAASINSFSINAGIVCHFISDYFCTPHSDLAYYEKRITEHLLYEKDLHRFACSLAGKEAMQRDFQWTFHSYASIKQGIEELHRIYADQERSYKNDLRFAVAASTSISEYMLQEALYTAPASVCLRVS